MTQYPIQSAFSRGVISKKLASAVHLDQYRTSLADGLNGFVLRHGGFRKRAGTKYVSLARKRNNKTVRSCVLKPFYFQPGQYYVLEMGDRYIRFHTSVDGVPGTVLLDGEPYEVKTPWTRQQAYEAHYKQIGDTIRVTHPDLPVYLISRFSETNWTVEAIEFDDGPYQEIISGYGSLVPTSTGGIIQGVSSATTAGLGVASSSSESLAAWQAFDDNRDTEWQAAANGEQWLQFRFFTSTIVTGYRLSAATREETVVEQFGDPQDPSFVIYKIPAPLRMARAWVFEGSATTSGTDWVTLDQQAAQTGWGEGETRYYTFENNTGFLRYRLRVIALNSSPTLLRPCSIGGLKFATSGSRIGELYLTATDITQINGGDGFKETDVGRAIRLLSEDAYWHWGKISEVTGAKTIHVDMHSPPLPTVNAITTYRLGAFSDTTGFPARICGYQGRLVYARSNENPRTIFATRPEDYDSFETSIPAKADDGIMFSFPDTEEIAWIEEADDLIICTPTRVRSIGPANVQEAVSAANLKQSKPVRVGAAAIQPANVGVALIFVGRLRKTLHELVFDFGVNGLQAPDLSVFSDDLLRAKVKEMAWVHLPNYILWILLDNGDLVSMTYERDQRMVAFAPHRMGASGKVESICSVTGTDRDELWLAVNRNGWLSIEQMQDEYEGGDVAEAVYLDTALTYRGEDFDGGKVTKITDIPTFFEGRTVTVVADGAKSATKTIDYRREIELDAEATTVHLGYAYDFSMTTLRIPVGSNDGSGLGRKKVLKKIYVDVSETGELTAQPVSGGEPQHIVMRKTTDAMDEAPPLTTGMQEVRVADSWRNNGQLVLSSSAPVPVTVLSITPGFEGEP